MTTTAWNTAQRIFDNPGNGERAASVGFGDGLIATFVRYIGADGTNQMDIVTQNASGEVISREVDVATALQDEIALVEAPDGGFYLAFRGISTPDGDDIRVMKLDDAGQIITVGTITPGGSARNPSIAVNPDNGQVFVTYEHEAGSIRGRMFDALLGEIEGQPEVGILLRSDDNPSNVAIGAFENETVALTNGHFVTVFNEDDADQGIDIRISDGTTGANLTAFNIGATPVNGVTDDQPEIVALTGGGFAVVWREITLSRDKLMVAVFDNDGAEVTPTTELVSTILIPSHDVVALDDGGFFVAYTDGGNAEVAVSGTRFDANGAIVGDANFDMVDEATGGFPNKIDLSKATDGRIILTFNDQETSDVVQQIFDTRDGVIVADGTEGTITASANAPSDITGTDEGETFIQQDLVMSVDAKGGNDTIVLRNALSDISPDDTAKRAMNIDGGEGHDTLDITALQPDGETRQMSVTVSLDSSISINPLFGQNTSVRIDGIESVIGAGATRYTMTGNNDGNRLIGGEDRDTLKGLGGDDTIEGGDGRDQIEGGAGDDVLNGGDDEDRIFGGGDNDTIDGGEADDTIDAGEGSDRILGGGGNDRIILSGADNTGIEFAFGGEGSDTFILTNEAGGSYIVQDFEGLNRVDLTSSTAGWIERGPTSGVIFSESNEGVSTAIDIFGNMTVSLSDFDDVANVNATYTFVDGRGGNDLIGFKFETQADGGADIDTVQFAGILNIDFAFDMETGEVSSGRFSTDYFRFENANMADGDDAVFGTSDTNVIDAGGGDDTIDGRGGDDIVKGGAGDDILEGGDNGAGGDTAIYNGNRADFSVTQAANGKIIVEDLDPSGPAGDEGKDVLTGFEHIQFADQTVAVEDLAGPVFAETGTVSLTDTVQTVTLEQSFENPVVIAFVATERGAQPVTVRIVEAEGNTLSLRLQEPNHLDGAHTFETVNFMVVEAGTHILPDGTFLEAGTVQTDKLTSEGFESVDFDVAFDDTPVILSQVQTFNGTDFVTTRQTGASEDGFSVAMQEEEALNGGGHIAETVGWVALEAGEGRIGDFQWQAGRVDGVSSQTATVDFGDAFDDGAGIIATLSSFNGRDAAWVRGEGSAGSAVDLSVEEDTSFDDETAHTAESVDYFVFSDTGTMTSIEPRLFDVIETGTVSLTDAAQTIILENDFENPVVMAFVATKNGTEPVNVRVNETSEGVTLRLQEPDSLNGAHSAETVNYMVVEAGTWVLPDGTVFEAGIFEDSVQLSNFGHQFNTFGNDFDEAPIVLTQTQGDGIDGFEFATVRQVGPSESGVQFTIQNEEALMQNGDRPSDFGEDIGYFAIEAGSGSVNGVDWLAGRLTGVSDNTTSVDLADEFDFDGAVNAVASLTSMNGEDPAWVRGSGATETGFEVFVEEDTSRDAETGHTGETVDFFVFDEPGLMSAYEFDAFL